MSSLTCGLVAKVVFRGGIRLKDGSGGGWVRKCFVGNEEEENLHNLKENTGPCPLCQFLEDPAQEYPDVIHLDFCLLSQEGEPVTSGDTTRAHRVPGICARVGIHVDQESRYVVMVKMNM